MNKKPLGLGIMYGFLAVAGILLLAATPIVTQSAPEGQGWWTQPYFMPMISLLLVVIPAVYLTIQHVRTSTENGKQSEIQAELLHWLKPAEFFLYYIIYIFLLGAVGYFLSTAIFIAGLSWRVGLRDRKWVIIGVFTALLLVAVFRWGLRIWVEPAWLYDLFPRGIRLFLSRYF